MKNSNDFTKQKRCSEYEFLDTHEQLEDNSKIMEDVLAFYCVTALTNPEIRRVPMEQMLETLLLQRGYVWLTDKHRNTELWMMCRRVKRYLSSETRPVISLSEEDKILADNMFGEPVKVKADYIVASPDKAYVNVVSVKGGNARLDKEDLVSEWETYFLLELGKKLYPNATVTAEINYLRDEDSKKEIRLMDENFFSPTSDTSNKTTRITYSDEVITYFRQKKFFEAENQIICHDCGSCPNQAKCNYERPLVLTDSIKVLNADNVPLTIQQRQGATTHDERVLIKAKAGSGKTTVTALNCLDAIKKGESPDNILMVSYTVNGAQEIVNRVQSFLNGTPLSEEELQIQRRLGTDITDTSTLNLNAQKIIHGTFNSFCQTLIDENYELLGYEKPPTVITADKRLEFINRLQDKYPKIPGLKYKDRQSVLSKSLLRGDKNDALEFVSTLFHNIKKRDLSSANLESIIENEVRILLDPLTKVKTKPLTERDLFLATEYLTIMFQEYQQTLQEQCLIEYADHPVLASKIHDLNPHIFDDLHYIYVDEFQDTTESFLSLITRMCDHVYTDPVTNRPTPVKLFCVGDDKQALFRFANATDRGILNFESIYGQSTVIDVRENFRCSKESVDFVNALNVQLGQKFRVNVAEPLVATAGPGDPVVVKAYQDLKQEYEDIARMVKTDIDNGIPPQEIFIQAATRRELIAIGSELAKYRIPVVTKCAVSIIENSNVQAALSFLRSAVVLYGTDANSEHRLENDYLIYTFTKNQNETEELLSLTSVKEEAWALQNELTSQPIKNPEQLLEYLNRLDPEGIDECYQEFLNDYKNCKNLTEVKTAYTTFINFGKERTFKRDGNFNAVSLGTPWSIKGLEGQSVYTCFDGYDSKEFYKMGRNSERQAQMVDKVNLAYTSCTRIAGTKEYEGLDGQMHRGTLHVTGLRIFAKEPKTGQIYENRFLDAAFAAVGKPFVIDKNTPASAKGKIDIEFPTMKEFFHLQKEAPEAEVTVVPKPEQTDEPTLIRGNTL